MATNVTEKDKTLNEIIEWLRKSKALNQKIRDRVDINPDASSLFDGKVIACDEAISFCRSKLLHQSEGAEISNREELTELVARKLWLEWNCELEGIDKTADDWAKLDSGTVFDKAEADGWRNVAWQILEGLRRYKVRKYKKWREERGLGKTTNEMAIDR